MEYLTKWHRIFTGSYIVNLVKKSVTSLGIRKVIVKLRNENKLSSGDISKTVRKSTSGIHIIFNRTWVNWVMWSKKKPPGRPMETTTREDR